MQMFLKGDKGLINIHIFYYSDSQLSRRSSQVPMSPDNRCLTVLANLILGVILQWTSIPSKGE